MPFDWTKYFELAEELSKRQEEACLRSAISRAYYSIYNTAKKRPAVLQYAFDRDGRSHAELWDLYDRNSASQECKRIAFVGKRLKRVRIEADYEPIVGRLDETVARTLEEARECLNILSSLDTELPKPVPKVFSY